jgi:hypothetical protein
MPETNPRNIVHPNPWHESIGTSHYALKVSALGTRQFLTKVPKLGTNH